MSRLLRYIVLICCMSLFVSCSNSVDVFEEPPLYIHPSLETMVSTRAEQSYVHSTSINACAVQLVSRHTFGVIQQNTFRSLLDGTLERITMYNDTPNYFGDLSDDMLYVNNGAGYYQFRAIADINSKHTFTNEAYSEKIYSVQTDNIPAYFVGKSYVNQSGDVALEVKPITSSLKITFLAADGSNQLTYSVDSVVLVGIPVCSIDMSKVRQSADSVIPSQSAMDSLANIGILKKQYSYHAVPKYGELYVDNIFPGKTAGENSNGVMLRVYTRDLVGGVFSQRMYEVSFTDKDGISFHQGKRYSINIRVNAKQAVIDGGIIVGDYDLAPDVITIKYGS